MSALVKMPSIERDASRDSEQRLNHKHSQSSDNGRAIIPMWDSSDPDRAPPPLPMNPSSPIITSRPNTSTAIQNAHAALAEKARENTYVTNIVAKRIEASPERSPERSLIRGAAHKRMQSLHTGHVKDLSSFIENSPLLISPSSPEKAPFRPTSPIKDPELKLLEKSISRTATPTPTPPMNNSGRDTPTLKSSMRKPPQSILGENAPPQSATMLALQNMASREIEPLADATNGSSALVRTPQSFDAISHQILSLTSIATSLQREMANLSRRSKDNATDLVSLKEATNARDEDIRKSLRELITNMAEPPSRTPAALPGTTTGAGGYLLDNKPHDSPNSRSIKPYVLPRIPSPKSFADPFIRESTPTASSGPSYNLESAASIALLEKIFRDMGTKDGQEHLLVQLTELIESLSHEKPGSSEKLDEVLQIVRTQNISQDLDMRDGNGAGNNRGRGFSFEEAPRLELDFESPRSGPMTRRVESLLNQGAPAEPKRLPEGARGSEVLNDELMNIIRAIKDSVAQGGGLTAEVKALVRELRGEVLGMGREIGRKLDEIALDESTAKEGAEIKEQMDRVVQEGVDDMKVYMERVLQESHHKLAAREVVDYQEIYNAVRTALKDKPKTPKQPGIEKEDIIEAVRLAWESYKPDIEVQQFGLEREELLGCLREGLHEYAPRDDGIKGATRDEVFMAVVEGLKHFTPPKDENMLSREEIVDSVRECLEEFEFPAPEPEPRGPEISKDDIFHAVKDGLHDFDFSVHLGDTRDVNENLTKVDVYEAVKSVLEATPMMEIFGEQLLEQLKSHSNSVVSRAVNSEISKDDVFDAVKAGLEETNLMEAFGEQLIEQIQSAQPVVASRDTGESLTRDDILYAVKAGLDDAPMLEAFGEHLLQQLKEQIDASNSTALTSTGGAGITKGDVFDAVKAGLEETPIMEVFGERLVEQIREEIQATNSRSLDLPNVATATVNREDVFDAVKASLIEAPLMEIFGEQLIKDLRDEMQAANATSLTREIGGSLTRDDVFDAVKASLVQAPMMEIFGEQLVKDLRDELQTANSTSLTHDVGNGLTRDDVYDAVKASLEHNPMMEIFGDQMIEKLKDEIQSANSTSITREVGGSLTRDDVFEALKACLEEAPMMELFGEQLVKDLHTEIQSSNSTSLTRETSSGLTRDDVFDALKACLEEAPMMELFGEQLVKELRDEIQSSNSTSITQEVNGGLTRDDVFDAVKASLEEAPIMATFGEQLVKDLREEIQAANSTSLTHEVEGGGLTRDDVFDAVKASLEHTPMMEVFGEQMIEKLKDEIREMNASALSRDVSIGLTRDDVFDAVKASMADQPRSASSSEGLQDQMDQLTQTMRVHFQAVSDEAKQNVSAHGRDTEQVLDATKDGFERLRADIEAYVDRAADISEKDEVLASMRQGFNAIRSEMEALASNNDNKALDSVKSELEELRDSMSTALVHGSRDADKDEILEALREGIDSLRSRMEQPQGLNESIASGNAEILVALQDGIGGLRVEVEKFGNKPVDMTVNYEILDTLRAGIESLRADFDRLREEREDGDRAITEINEQAVIPIDGLKRNDIEQLEVLINQLNTKVESLESPSRPSTATPSEPASTAGLEHIEEMLRNVQESVAGFSVNDRSAPEDSATKEDIVAIETLLRNTKAKIDEMDPGQAVKEEITVIEALLLETRDNISELSSTFDDISKKDDLNIVEALVRDIVLDLTEMKEKAIKDAEDPEKVIKTDIEAVEAVCVDIKSVIDQMILNDIATLATQDDVKTLGLLVKEVSERLETHADTNLKAMDDRQAETVGVSERVGEIRDFLEEFHDHVKGRLEDGVTGVEALGTLLENISEAVNQQGSLSEDVRALFDAMKIEFEKSNAGVVGSKLEADEKFQQTWEKLDATWQMLDIKIEEKLDALNDKLEAAQESSEERAKAGAERDVAADSAVSDTKVVAEDLKALVESLSTNLTDSVEKMDEASRTVFNRVEDTFTRVEELHGEAKSDHQLTRGEVSKAIDAIEGVQNEATEYHPKMLEAIKSVLLIVGEHYEHSKITNNSLQQRFADIPKALPMIEAPPLPEEETTPVVEAYDDSQVHEKLDRLVGYMQEAEKSLSQPVPVHEAYDDSQIHEKLNKLVDCMQETEKSLAQPTPIPEPYNDSQVHEKLDKLVAYIHEAEKTLMAPPPPAQEPYNDSQVHEKLDKLVDHIHETDRAIMAPPVHEPYNDTQVHEKLDKIVDSMHEAEKSRSVSSPIQEPYNDSHVQEKLDRLVDHMQEAGKSFAQLETLDKIHQQVMNTAAEVSNFVSAQKQRITDEHDDREKAAEEATIVLERQLARKEEVEATVSGLREEEDLLRESIAIMKAEKEDLAHSKMRLSADVSSLETALRIRREELHAMEARAEGLERRILEGVIDHSRALLMTKSNKPGRDFMSRKRVPSRAPSATGSTISNATSRASHTTQSAVNMAVGSQRYSSNAPPNASTNPGRRILSLSQITHNVPTGGTGGFKRSHSVKAPAGAGPIIPRKRTSWAGRQISHSYGDLNKENLALKEDEEDEMTDDDDDDVSETEATRRSSRGTTIMTTTGVGPGESIDEESTEWTGSIDGENAVDESNSLVLYGDAGAELGVV